MPNRSERKEKWLKEHDRLSRLFVEDRLSFERERKKLIDEMISGSRNEARRKSLRHLQNRWDNILRHACSEYNRFVLIQMLFWHEVRNVWLPALKDYEHALKESLVFGWKPIEKNPGFLFIS